MLRPSVTAMSPTTGSLSSVGLAFSPEGSSHVRYHVRSDVRSGQLAGTLKRPVHRGFRRLMLGMLGLFAKKNIFCNSLSFQE